MGICHIWHGTAHNCVLLSYRRIRRYSVCRLKRLEACDLSHVRFTHLATSKEDILAASRELIKENGWAAVSIRAVASRCSVSTGTIYNYYESKADLLGDTIESIWREIFFHPEAESVFKDVTACISWIYKRLEYGNAQFPGFFSLHSFGFMKNEKTDGNKKMLQTWEHILNGLCNVLKNDPKIRSDVFDQQFTEKQFADILFSLVLVSMIRQDYDPSSVLMLVNKTLY